MKTSINGIMSPEPGNGSSKDTLADIIEAVRNNANIMENMFKLNGDLGSVQSDYTKGWRKALDGSITIIGYADPVKMVVNGRQVIGKITFEKPFPNICSKVTGSDAGGAGMSFGFYNFTKTGCTWCTCKGLGDAGINYAPNYTAIGR